MKTKRMVDLDLEWGDMTSLSRVVYGNRPTTLLLYGTRLLRETYSRFLHYFTTFLPAPNIPLQKKLHLSALEWQEWPNDEHGINSDATGDKHCKQCVLPPDTALP